MGLKKVFINARSMKTATEQHKNNIILLSSFRSMSTEAFEKERHPDHARHYTENIFSWPPSRDSAGRDQSIKGRKGACVGIEYST